MYQMGLIQVQIFFCVRKKCLGLNMQTIYYHKHWFLDIDILYLVSALYYLLLGTLTIFKLLETPGFVCNGITMYIDNTYINTLYMILHFKAVSSGPKDAYNLYYSQIQINIECDFGVLINRWAILRSLFYNLLDIDISLKIKYM